MADMGMNIEWQFDALGQIEVTVHPEGHPNVVLGSFALDEVELMDEFYDDLEAFAESQDRDDMLDWELFIANQEEMLRKMKEAMSRAGL